MTAVTRYVPRHLRRPARTPRIAASLLLAAAPLAGFSLPTSTPPPVWAAVGAGVEPVEPAPGTAGPTPVPTVPPMAPLPVQTAPPKPPAWVSPLPGYCAGRVGGHYGAPRDGGSRPHRGVDMGFSVTGGPYAPYGTPVRAIHSGVIGHGYEASGAGIYVTLNHGDGTASTYFHLASRAVPVGARVKAGDVLGYVGSSGGDYVVHLHFETHPWGLWVKRWDEALGANAYQDPVQFMAERGVRIAC